MTIYTAIIGNYDELKEPFYVTPGWNYICFTDQELKSNVWTIVKVDQLKLGPAKTARYYKIMFYKHIQDEYSIWIDATFFINCNLNEWWEQFVEPFTTIFHPFDRCLYTDIKSCLKGRKGDSEILSAQRDAYKKMGVPENNGLIASGILMRRNCSEVRNFCKTWWHEVQTFTERDQVAFGYTNWRIPNLHHSITWDYTYRTEFIFNPHKHKSWSKQKFEDTKEKYGSNKTS